MGGVVNVQNPSACFSISAFGPLQKLTLTLLASGALNRISTRELLSTRGYFASRTLDAAGLKSPESCAKQKGIATIITTAISRMAPPDIFPQPERPGSGSAPVSAFIDMVIQAYE